MSPFCSADRYTSLCRRTSHSGTDGLCLWKLKRVLHWAMLRVCVHLLADPCMPVSGLCITSRKWQEKQNWTLCKQLMTNFWRDHPTLYLHDQLCSLRISCLQWEEGAQIQCCLCGIQQQMVYVIACCVPAPTAARCVSQINAAFSQFSQMERTIFCVRNWKTAKPKTQLFTFQNVKEAFFTTQDECRFLQAAECHLCFKCEQNLNTTNTIKQFFK